MRTTALVVCPGRGTYNAAELGYLARHHQARADWIATADRYRESRGETPVSVLDGAARYQPAVLTRGDNASALIMACAYADFLAIDRERYEVVAVTGNSMGWYIALGCAGALGAADCLHLVDTMGGLMHQASLGGQMLYPWVDEDWQPIPGRREELLARVAEIGAREDCALYRSIELGGMLVVGGDDAGLAAFAEGLPRVQDRFPLRLPNHAAFHTPLQQPVAARARAMLSADPFGEPEIALVDGRGAVWQPQASVGLRLWDYTLDHQVVEPYDFSAAVRVGVREFAPECVIVLGPGTTLGGAVAQALIAAGWKDLGGKAGFVARQREAPVVLSMGIEEQRAAVVATSGAD